MARTGEVPLWGDRGFVSPETYDAMVALLARLDAVVAAETAALSRHDHAGLAEATRRKRQGLLEFARLSKAMAGTVPSQDILGRLAAFRARLAANEAALRVELRAAQDVGATIVRALREAESDGTYSRGQARESWSREEAREDWAGPGQERSGQDRSSQDRSVHGGRRGYGWE